MYYCIGYTSNNDWSTSEIPLDQYQEKLQESEKRMGESQSSKGNKASASRKGNGLHKERVMKEQ